MKGIGGLVLRLTGLPAIWGLITTAVSALGGVLSFLLSPIGLIGAAFVAAGLLIWHFWEPIKAYFLGFFSGVWQALTPLTLLMEGIGWVLQKLGLIPVGLDEAKRKAESLTPKAPVMYEWDPQQKKMVPKSWNWSPDAPAKTPPPVTTPPVIPESVTARRLKEISENTKTTADNTKKIGPGDIVFKNLPQALALSGAYQEARVITQPVPGVAASAAGGVLSVPSATQGAVIAPVAAPSAAPVFQINFNGVGSKSLPELEKMVRDAIRDALATTNRANRGSFRDRD
ncbi:hypothetical protein [Enterobacter sp. Bisph1]|uniref:hypothetical protein n=1 Tax=Enterobacter sp. Bisph1 TaxID=1274399 RepID=UPI000A933981|nr:hypothetical protein [Enterobacter sp. Bisph1]